MNFPNDEESSWEEVKKARKAEEKHKTTLKNPKMGSLGKQEGKHPEILDAELETCFGEQ